MAKSYVYGTINSFQLVKEWCKKHRIQVIEAPKGTAAEYVSRETGSVAKIIIPVSDSHTARLYTILHECGHHLIGQRSKDQRFGEGYSRQSSSRRHTGTLRYRIDVLDEELEAWHRGLALAERLGIYINQQDYKRYRDIFVRGYAALAGKKNFLKSQK